MIKLTPKQVQAANLLAIGRKAKDVAAEIDVTPQTISAWKRDAGFTVYQNRLKMELAEAARDSLRASAKEATDSLVDLLRNSDNDEVRRKTAINILEMVGLYGNYEECYTKFGWGIGPTSMNS